MTTLLGALNINDNSRVFLQTIGQSIVYDAVQQVIAEYNAASVAAQRMFVEGDTTDWLKRYKLPGGGRLQRTSLRAPLAEFKAGGSWDVAFPLESFGTAFSIDRISMAYMTAQDLQNHLQTVQTQATNTVRHEIFRRLFNNGGGSPIPFVDDLRGTLNIQPLANGDSTVYPPKIGSEAELTSHSHYIVSGYLGSAISDVNDPFLTVRDTFEEHFGAPTAGSNLAVFVNDDITTKVLDLTRVTDVNDRYVAQGVNTAVVNAMPNIPGRILGRHSAGVWVSEWRWVPSGYMLAVDLNQAPPLMRRVDLPETGLQPGLQLIAKDMNYPIESSYWDMRFGYGVGNRLNGVIVQLKAPGTYDVPAAFA